MSLGPRGSHPEQARGTASQAGGHRQRPEQQMANPVEMPRQQEKGPQGVSVEARDPKGSSPQDPGATSAGRDAKLPGAQCFRSRANRKASGAGHPVGSHPRMAQKGARSLRERDAEFHAQLHPSGAAGRQQGKAPASVPARRLAVPGTQPRRERGVKVWRLFSRSPCQPLY